MNSIKEKVREMRLRWYGHRQKMEENNKVRVIVDMIVTGKRPRGRPKGRWTGCVQRDMQELRITPDGGCPGQNILEATEGQSEEEEDPI